jgi:hypothetical protein
MNSEPSGFTVPFQDNHSTKKYSTEYTVKNPTQKPT